MDFDPWPPGHGSNISPIENRSLWPLVPFTRVPCWAPIFDQLPPAQQGTRVWNTLSWLMKNVREFPVLTMGNLPHWGNINFYNGFPTNGHPMYHGPIQSTPLYQNRHTQSASTKPRQCGCLVFSLRHATCSAQGSQQSGQYPCIHHDNRDCTWLTWRFSVEMCEDCLP